MRKVLILLLAVLLTGCYTVLKVPSQKKAQKTEVTFGVDANRGDHCYSQKYYETVYIREKSSSTRVIRVPRYRVNCNNRPYTHYRGSYWRYYGSYYNYSGSYENDQSHSKRERDYRPRGKTVGRSSGEKDKSSRRSRDRSRRDNQDSDRDRSRSGRRSRSGSEDSGN